MVWAVFYFGLRYCYASSGLYALVGVGTNSGWISLYQSYFQVQGQGMLISDEEMLCKCFDKCCKAFIQS